MPQARVAIWASTPTLPSLRWVQKMLGVQRWQDVRIWGDVVLCGFPLVVLGSQPFRIMLKMSFVLFLLCFVGHRAVYGRYSH